MKSKKNVIWMLYLLSLVVSPLMSEIDMQKGVYDAAEEMIRFDEKMNKAIAEHNKIDAEDDAEMRLQTMMINDFEETEDGYVLTEEIEEFINTEVEVRVEEGLLIISTVTVEKEITQEELNISEINTMSSFNVSLFIPNDADEAKMEKSYKDGILKVFFPKK